MSEQSPIELDHIVSHPSPETTPDYEAVQAVDVSNEEDVSADVQVVVNEDAPAQPDEGRPSRWRLPKWDKTTGASYFALIIAIVFGIGAWVGQNYGFRLAATSNDIGFYALCADHEELRNTTKCKNVMSQSLDNLGFAKRNVDYLTDILSHPPESLFHWIPIQFIVALIATAHLFVFALTHSPTRRIIAPPVDYATMFVSMKLLDEHDFTWDVSPWQTRSVYLVLPVLVARVCKEIILEIRNGFGRSSGELVTPAVLLYGLGWTYFNFPTPPVDNEANRLIRNLWLLTDLLRVMFAHDGGMSIITTLKLLWKVIRFARRWVFHILGRNLAEPRHAEGLSLDEHFKVETGARLEDLAVVHYRYLATFAQTEHQITHRLIQEQEQSTSSSVDRRVTDQTTI